MGKVQQMGSGPLLKNADHQVVSKMLDITCAKDFVDLLSNTNSKIKLFLVKEEDINQIEAEIPSVLLPVPTTMKIHQLVFTKPGSFSSRDVSCFCSIPVTLACNCFQPVISALAPKMKNTFSFTDNISQMVAPQTISVKWMVDMETKYMLGAKLINQFIIKL